MISIAHGWTPGETGYDEITTAVQEAEAAGMPVVYSRMASAQNYQFVFNRLGRDPLVNRTHSSRTGRARGE